jgi:spermidine synthase/MFS family permease
MKASSGNLHAIVSKFAIWLLTFVVGGFVMVAELVGARVLTPYFGNTVYVWGSVIGIFLLALATGYAIGGKMTQRFSGPVMPAIFAVLAGLYIAVTPSFDDQLAAWLYNVVTQHGIHIKWGALVATIILYGLPMALLGGVSPYCVHIATKSGSEVGIRAGSLYAISTIGSFIGCMLTAFVLIPTFPLSLLIVCAGVGMLLVGVMVAAVLANRFGIGFVFAVALVGMIVVVGVYISNNSWHGDIKAYNYPLQGRLLSRLSPKDLGLILAEAQRKARKEAARYADVRSKVIFQKETPYHRISVVQDGPTRSLIFGEPGFHGAQNCLDLRDLYWHVSEYTHLSFAGFFFKESPRRVCVIGVGAGMIPRALELCIPGVEIDAVEIDPAVISVAEKYFYWRPSRNVRVYTQDGRSFINWVCVNERPLYDWVILDAYSEDYVPFHLTTKEFLHTVSRVLNPDGVVISNVRIDTDLYGCQARTLQAVFGNVTAFVGHRSGNVILVSQKGRNKPLTTEEAAKVIRRLRIPPNSRIDPVYILTCLSETQNWSKEGPVLTDLWSPVENLLQ